MEHTNSYSREAVLITEYLLAVKVGDREKEIYSQAMETLKIPFSKYEEALWEEMLLAKFKMASIDAALALTEPSNNVRRKLYTMLAILEASPDYTSFFLSKNYSKLYIFRLVAVGVRAVFRALIGLIIIYSIKIKCR